MKTDIGQAVSEWYRVLDHRFLRRHPSIPAKAEDYHFKGHNSALDPLREIDAVIYHPDITPYAIILNGPKKGKPVESALLGFTADGCTADCLEIHGGQRRYRQLAPLWWDRALLGEFLEMGKSAGLDAVTVVPGSEVVGDIRSDEGLRRLVERYDGNATYHGFRYSQDMKRYVFEF